MPDVALDPGTFAVGIAVLAGTVAATAVVARRLTAWLCPGWDGPAAGLATVVSAVAVAVLVGELLGTAGILSRWPVLGVTALAAVGARRWLPAPEPARSSAAAPEAVRRSSVAPAVAALALAAVAWVAGTAVALDHGPSDADSVVYHLPHATKFVQEETTVSLHYLRSEPSSTVFPHNAELLSALLMVPFRRDVAVPLAGLASIAFVGLAAHCLGAVRGRGVLVAAVVVAGVTVPGLLNIQPGSSKPDLLVVGGVVASAALVATWCTDPRGPPGRWPRPVFVAGLAAGLAAGAKFTAAPTAGFLLAALVVLAPRAHRARAAVLFSGGVALVGGYWYVRNIVHTGSPVPQFEFGIGQRWDLPLHEEMGATVIDYAAGDIDGLGGRLADGFEFAIGPLWAVVVGLVAVATAVAAVKGRRLERALLGVAVAAAGVYLVTPFSAGGEPGDPILFGPDMRFAAPAVALALASALMIRTVPVWAAHAAAAVAAGVSVTGLASVRGRLEPGAGHVAAGVGVVLVAAGLAVLHRRASPRFRRPALVLAAMVVLAALQPVQQHYLRADDERFSGWWGGLSSERGLAIGTAVDGPVYYLSGRALANRVDFVGEPDPDRGLVVPTTCVAFKNRVIAMGVDVVVVGDALRPLGPFGSRPTDARRWLEADPRALVVERLDDEERTTIVDVRAGLEPDACA